METSLSDRSANAEDASHEDIWDDSVDSGEEIRSAGTILPPRREKEGAHLLDSGRLKMGLRIGVSATRAVTGVESSADSPESSAGVVRLDPEINSQPWAPRQFRFRQRPESQESDRNGMGESREWGKPKKQPVIWMIGIGAAIVAAVFWAVMMLQSIDESLVEGARPGEMKWVLEPDGMTDDMLAIKDVLGRQSEAEGIFHELITARSLDDILPKLRDAGQVAGLIRPDDRLIGAWKQNQALVIEQWSAFHRDGLSYGLLTGTLPDYSPFEVYFIREEGRLLFDWKATSGYGTADFGELKQKRGNPAEIRGWVSNSGFYTQAFPEDEFQCHRLLSPDMRQSVWAYSRRGGEVETFLRKHLEDGDVPTDEPQLIKATFQLEAGPEGALPNQWLVRELLHKDWIAP